MNNDLQESTWSENVILADADYIDQVTFHLTTNFERMLERPVPPADLPKWLDCIALDGGLRPSTGSETLQEIMVILVHRKDKAKFDNFLPADFEKDLNGKAFKDQLGEFAISAYPIEELTSAEEFLPEILKIVIAQKKVKRIMVIPAAENATIYNKVREVLNKNEDDTKHITVFTMDPMPGGHFQQEILGYSLMAALGIKGEEIQSKINTNNNQ